MKLLSPSAPLSYLQRKLCKHWHVHCITYSAARYPQMIPDKNSNNFISVELTCHPWRKDQSTPSLSSWSVKQRCPTIHRRTTSAAKEQQSSLCKDFVHLSTGFCDMSVSATQCRNKETAGGLNHWTKSISPIHKGRSESKPPTLTSHTYRLM